MALRTADVAPPSITRLVRPRQRQTSIAIVGLALVLACALGAALLARSSAHRVQVVVAAHDLQPGVAIQPSDLRVTGVSPDTNARFIAASAAGDVIGHLPRGFIPAGTPLNAAMVAETVQVPIGNTIVGAVLSPGAVPTALQVGQRVDVVVVAKDSGGATAAQTSPAVVGPAVVYSVAPAASNADGGEWVSLEAQQSLGPVIAQAAQDGVLRLELVP
jgi:hypothetical protein